MQSVKFYCMEQRADGKGGDERNGDARDVILTTIQSGDWTVTM